MKKGVCIGSYLLIFIILATFSYAEITVLTYSDSETLTYGISFLDNQLADEYSADILFYGYKDKDEGYEIPNLYAGSGEGGIFLNPENVKCSNFQFEENLNSKEAEISEGKEYCVLARDGNTFVNVRVIELSEDWSTLTIEWSILDDKVKEVSEGSGSSNGWNWDFLKKINWSIILFILVDLILIIIILYVFRYIRKTKSSGRIGIHHPSVVYASKKPKIIGYCVKCSKKVLITNPYKVHFKSGADAIEGKCPKCQTEVFRIIAKHPDTRQKAYCVKCRKKIFINNPKRILMDNNSKAISGECPKCKNKVFKIYEKHPDTRVSGYCVKCKKKVHISKSHKIVMKNNKHAVQGKCPSCSTEVYRITGNEKSATGTIEKKDGSLIEPDSKKLLLKPKLVDGWLEIKLKQVMPDNLSQDIEGESYNYKKKAKNKLKEKIKLRVKLNIRSKQKQKVKVKIEKKPMKKGFFSGWFKKKKNIDANTKKIKKKTKNKINKKLKSKPNSRPKNKSKIRISPKNKIIKNRSKYRSKNKSKK
ncbi:MAG: DUF5679 domain-containing protein [Candidatus Woesearchaeota archaeon]